jgi:cobalt-zinc-cadmium efflux system outer membrane protein
VKLAHLVCAVLAAAALDAAAAERPAQIVDLDTVMRLVREGPRLGLERQGIAQAEADRITAGTYPNPTLSYGLARPSGGQRTNFDATVQHQATLQLPLLVNGQRGARVERAEREIEAARARVAAGASTHAAEAGAAFVGLLAAQEKAALLTQAIEEVARLQQVISGRQESGVASRYDVARFDVELGGLRARLIDARAEVSDRSGMLAALLALPGWQPVASGTLAPLPLEPGKVAAQDARLYTPAVAAALKEEAAAQSGIDVARRERWPVPSVGVGQTWTNDPYGASTFVGLTMEIPLFDTRRGPLARARADAHAATLRRQLVTAETAAHLQRLTNVIAVRREALDRFEQDAASKLPPLRQMAEDAYRLGRGSILELLDATRSRYDLLQARRDLAAGLLEAQVRLLALRGALENPMPAAVR